MPVDNEEHWWGKRDVLVLDNTGDLIGEEIRDGIKQYFLHWNTKENGTGENYSVTEYYDYDTNIYYKNTIEITKEMGESNINLYAIYTKESDVIGKIGPAGGIIFYDAGSNQSWGRYLEAAPQSTEWELKEWGKYVF